MKTCFVSSLPCHCHLLVKFYEHVVVVFILKFSNKTTGIPSLFWNGALTLFTSSSRMTSIDFADEASDDR